MRAARRAPSPINRACLAVGGKALDRLDRNWRGEFGADLVARGPFDDGVGTFGKRTIAPDFDTLISRTTCLRPRNSITPVLDTEGWRSSSRSSIERCAPRGIIPPSRLKLDAT